MKIITPITFSFKNLTVTLLLLLLGHVAVGQTINSLPYSKTDNFDAYNPTNATTATNTIPAGWSYSSTSAAYNGRGTGTATAGGFIGYGSGTDFSLGALPSGSNTHTYTISFTNNSGTTITSLTLSWDYEQWRYGTANTSGWDVTGTGQLAANATLNAKDFSGVAGSTAGTTGGLTTPVSSFTLSGLSITNGQSFGLTWVTTNLTGADNGVSIDNFSIQASGAAAAVPVVTGGTVNGTVGTALTNYQISATNSPTSYAIASGTLPAGLSLATATGIISGTPTAAGTPSVTVTATNGTGTSSPAATLNFDIVKGSQTITFNTLTNKQYGDTNFNLTATTTSPLTVTYGSSNTNVATVSGNVVTIVGVGSTDVTASQAGDANYNAASSVMRTLTVTAKSLTITELTGNNKPYDATIAATVSGTATLNGVLAADTGNVSLAGTPSYTFATAGVGNVKPISVSGLSLTGSKAANYTLAALSGVSANITAKTITVSGVTAQDRAYNGTTVATISGGTLSGVETADVSNVSISTTGTFASANVNTGIGVTVALTGSAAANYSLTQPGITANITKANQTITFNTLPALNTGSAALDLNTYASTSSSLTLTYASSNPSVVSVSGNTLTVVGVGTATITASQAGNSNYNPATNATQNVTVSLVPSVLYNHNFNDTPSTSPYTTSPLSTTPAGVLNTNITASQWVSSTGAFTNFAGSSGNALVIQPTNGATSTMTLNMTIASGYKFTLTDFSFWGRRTANGPSVSSITVNGITVSNAISISTGGAAVPSTAVLNPVQSLTGAISVVLNLTAPTSTGQNLRLDDFILKGYITQITEVTWENGSWSNGTGPTSSLDAIIKSAYSTSVNGVFTAKKLTLTSGSFTINSGNDITVVNEVINSIAASNFVIENNGNLLQDGTTNNNTGGITVHRNSSPLYRFDYTLWSSPVSGQKLFAFSPLTTVTPTSRFYSYDTLSDDYLSIASPSTTDFANGIGYLIRAPWDWPTYVNSSTPGTSWTGTFEGTPHNGDIPVTLITTGNGYNAVGNPYPSAVSIATFLSNNSGSIDQTLWFWRRRNGSEASAYVTYTGGTYSNGSQPVYNLEPGQGFIVKYNGSGPASINFHNTQRVDTDGIFFKNNTVVNNADNSRVWLNLISQDEVVGTMAFGYKLGATNNLDDEFDGKYIGDSPLALNSIIDATELAVQHRSAPFVDTDVVPLSFKTDLAGTYSIVISEVDGLFADGAQAIYLKDNLTNTYHNLNAGAYTFVATAGTFNSRFEIVYRQQLESPIFTANTVVIYSQNNGFVVNSGNFVMSSIKVFDIRGRLIEEKKGINANEAKINGGLSNGILLVQITSEDGITVTKKVLK